MAEDSSTSETVSSEGAFGSGFRQVLEMLISLLISVLLVRTFLVEGYLISTGSMAPHLFGAHQKIVCPQCQLEFAVGTEFDRSVENEFPEWAVCPNCFYDEIETQNLPTDRGDHLLVWKNAFYFRPPRRFEVVVFRNPNSPLETFIKRVAGLPGEQVEIRDGNLIIDGALVRKTLAEQRALLLPVYEDVHTPTSEDRNWTPRWKSSIDASRWSRSEITGGWRFAGTVDGSMDSDRLIYRHSLRAGGDHITTVRMSEPLTPAQREAFEPSEELFPLTPEPKIPGVHYVEAINSLTCRGVLSERVFHRLLAIDQTKSFTEAIHKLYRQSQYAPVKDFEAYNAHSSLLPENEISEFFLSFEAAFDSGPGRFAVMLAVPGEQFVCHFDLSEKRVSLEEVRSGKSLRTGTFNLESDRSNVFVEISTIDRQICVAINGAEVCSPWKLAESSSASDSLLEIASIEQVEGTLDVWNLRLSRDVYYTSRHGLNAVGGEFQLGPDEYFMLGDNSSVSSDSRMWDRAAVPSKLLIGKPFAVHLPSRTTTIGNPDSAWQVRLPDFSRIRFVR